MREDMSEVIIERPRHGHRMRHFRRARRMDAKVLTRDAPERLLSGLGMGRGAALGRHRKMLNENLAPLRRYLERQINRPWDKVWSEIAHNLAVTSAVQQHVRDHVEDFVATRTFLKDGAVWVTTRYGKPVPLREGLRKLYVDPRTGILRRDKHYASWQQKRRADQAAAQKHRATRVREIAPDVQVHRLDDNCWWEVRLAPIPTRTVTYPSHLGTRTYAIRDKFTDVVRTAKLSKLPIAELYGRDGVFAAAKRQLSRREIAALGL
jgi:hypothetical protein